MKITIREVAKAAKVSIGTVSRVLNGHASVSADSARRVHEVVSSMNYKKLRQRTGVSEVRPLEGKSVAIVLLGMDRSLEALPAVASAIQGAEKMLSDSGATVLLANVPDLTQVPALLRRERIDGILIKGAMQGDLHLACARELLQTLESLPAVWFLGRPPGFSGDAVSPNDLQAGEMAARHLFERGHRNVAFLSPKPDHQLMRIRQMSFEWHARARGMSVRTYLGQTNKRNEFFLQAVQTVDRVQDLVDRLLADRDRATAVFVPADNVAVLVYRALAARGLQAGRDLSVISCNHERPLVAGLFPSLVTVDIHADEIGRLAVQHLATRIRQRDDKLPTELFVEPDLIEGDSVATLTADAN